MNTMDFGGKRHSRLCLGKLPIQWQHPHSNVESISDSWIVLLPYLWHFLHCPMATHASYENWSYHNGYGNGYGHFLDGVTYYPFYQNQPYYELNTNDTNPFLPSDCSDCIFISGLPKTIKKDEIISIFSKAGKIKFTKYGTFGHRVYYRYLYCPMQNPGNSSSNILGTQRIFLFLDRGTKTPTGDATVTYESSESAKNAIDKFDQMDFNGHGIISVKQALPDQKNPFAEKLVSLFSLEGSNKCSGNSQNMFL